MIALYLNLLIAKVVLHHNHVQLKPFSKADASPCIKTRPNIYVVLWVFSPLPVGCTAQQLIRTSTRHAAYVAADDDTDGVVHQDEDDDEAHGDGDETGARRL